MFIGIPSYVFATEVNHRFFVFVLFDCPVFFKVLRYKKGILWKLST